MYAVIKAGGKQQRVKAGDVIEVEYMRGDPGSTIDFKPLVVIDDDGKAHYGKELARAKVVTRLLGEQKGDKVKVFKYRPKSGYARTQGHRQLMTLLEVEEVALSPEVVARKPAAPPAEVSATEEPAEEPAEKAAAGKPAAKKPAARKPAAKKAAARKPAARKPAAKTPAPKKPTARKKS